MMMMMMMFVLYRHFSTGVPFLMAHRWLGGSVVRAMDTILKGPWFNAQLMRYLVTALGKLFTPTCLYRCKCLMVSFDS